MKKLKILIVEDDESSSKLISLYLKKIAKEIIYAKTGTNAVEACQNIPDIDLIMMDIEMLEMDGLEATRQIRKFNKEVIIIAQTACVFFSIRENALQSGCNEYISKPFNREELIALIKMLFKLSYNL